MQYVKVIVNKKIENLDHDFIYEVPMELMDVVRIGSVVAIPFGRSSEKGIVIGFAEEPGDYRVKFIDGLINEEFIFPETLLLLADQLSKYYMNTTIAMLRAMIPTGVNLFGKAQSQKIETWLVYQRDENSAVLRGKKQQALVNVIMERGEIKQKEAETLGFSAAVCRSLCEGNWVYKEQRPVKRYSYGHVIVEEANIPELTAEQAQAMEIIETRKEEDKRPILLHGVTGSGKTEIYLRLIEKTLRRGKQAIMLLPEIALTPQFIRIFENRFHGKIALMHSRLSAGERRDAWYALRRNEVQIALGARSCVFAPTENLGLIIIDEEHEDSYEQDTAPRFNAVKAAALRCENSNAFLVLGSATPSFESYRKALCGEYQLITLKNRVGNTPLPQIETVDMREELKDGWVDVISRRLFRSIEETLSEKKQVMLFLNRLGYHTFVSCRDCGFVYQCPECGVSLTYYRSEKQLKCNRCGYQRPLENNCPACKSKRIKYFGLGTEQLEEAVRRHFPDATVDLLDSEHVRRCGSLDEIYQRMKSGETDILIGTKMMAKGWDFPNVALTGIIAADFTLNFPDFRAGERTFQTISQVAGRCGRSKDQGKVILQTYRPDEPALILGGLQDFESYYRWESRTRKKFGYPPFTHMAKVVLTSPRHYLKPEERKEIAEIFASIGQEHCRVFGPAAGVYREQGKEKWIITFLGDQLYFLKETINKGILRLQREKIIDKNINVQKEIEPVHTA